MTSTADIGRMLIEVGENGRVLQELHGEQWHDVYMTDRIRLATGSSNREYRLEPKVTFYRVWEERFINHPGGPAQAIVNVVKGFTCFTSWEQHRKALSLGEPRIESRFHHIHDFEIEE